MSKTKQEEVKQKEVKKEVFTDIVFYKGGSHLMECFSDYPQWLREWLDEINRVGRVSYTEVLSGSGGRVTKLVIETNGIKQVMEAGSVVIYFADEGEVEIEIGQAGLLKYINAKLANQ